LFFLHFLFKPTHKKIVFSIFISEDLFNYVTFVLNLSIIISLLMIITTQMQTIFQSHLASHSAASAHERKEKTIYRSSQTKLWFSFNGANTTVWCLVLYSVCSRSCFYFLTSN